ncbi:chemotaxis protein [Maridesulfovibrio salexigens]|uniref:Response regulator receiver modulated CheW protein n=1 Tax=Maridesulfovibrio salexigens (strain ATCC 14822 / DSM 2638 / NCIMB 8403 / VKM B-1763) TaxID=526222 RepID=C6C035_MARSD|nr:chemotaxis protein [Maridesulfovibrio salexigens]ACS80906.1 response regulator receiver modulated CheW protein [Maridesulfovibrio salexigens DSM 2638]
MTGSKILLESGTNEVELLELYLDEGSGDSYKRWSFGLNVAKVKKIVREADLKNFSGHKKEGSVSRVSSSIDTKSPLVLGMFEFMGTVIPLIDLSGWLRMEPVSKDRRMVLVTEFNEVVSAFLVSGVNRIHRVSWSELESLQGNMAKYAEGTIIGTVKLTDPDRILQVLDLEQAMEDLNPDRDKAALEEVEESVECVYQAICADDSRSMRNLVKNSLERGGFEVDAYPNGLEIWKALQEISAKVSKTGLHVSEFVQLIVSDIEMPGMDGHALTKRIKEDPNLRDLTVYLFSSLITEELLHKGDAVGANRQYSKPQIATLVKQARVDLDDIYKCKG